MYYIAGYLFVPLFLDMMEEFQQVSQAGVFIPEPNVGYLKFSYYLQKTDRSVPSNLSRTVPLLTLISLFYHQLR